MRTTLDTIEALVTTALEEMSEELQAGCGNLENLGKTTSDASISNIGNALTEMDEGVQDHVTKALLAADLGLGFLVEEDTQLLRGHAGDTGNLAAILDPIDGTLSYTRGQHDYCSMFAVALRGRIIMGILGFYHPFRILVGRFDKTAAPGIQAGPRPDGPPRIACHYRLFRDAFRPTRKALEDAGCLVVPVPLDLDRPDHAPFAGAMDRGVGSNGAAIAAMLEGHWDAYIGPYMNLHDFAGPWGVAEANGAIAMQFEVPDNPNGNSWIIAPDPRFLVASRADYPKRYRIAIARDRDTADHLRDILAAIPD